MTLVTFPLTHLRLMTLVTFPMTHLRLMTLVTFPMTHLPAVPVMLAALRLLPTADCQLPSAAPLLAIRIPAHFAAFSHLFLFLFLFSLTSPLALLWRFWYKRHHLC